MKINTSFWKVNKNCMLKCGNQKFIIKNKDTVEKTIIMEEQYSHRIVLPQIFCHFLPCGHHVPQEMNLKQGKNAQLVWYGSTKMYANDKIMDERVDMSLEMDMAFESSVSNFLVEICNH